MLHRGLFSHIARYSANNLIIIGKSLLIRRGPVAPGRQWFGGTPGFLLRPQDSKRLALAPPWQPKAQGRKFIVSYRAVSMYSGAWYYVRNLRGLCNYIFPAGNLRIDLSDQSVMRGIIGVLSAQCVSSLPCTFLMFPVRPIPHHHAP